VNDFGERGVLEDGPASEWTSNGTAEVAIVEQHGGRMEIDVRAEAETLVATSTPAWPGWKAAIDGSPAATTPYNHAFLAVRVPEGAHRVTLRYRPDGFLYGAAVSGATLAVSLAVLWRRRRSAPNDARPDARMRAESAG